MRARVLIFALILCSFFIASMNVVIAQYSETFLDPKDDVIKQVYTDTDVNITENVTNKPNIDIREFVCSRNYRKVTLKITVTGEIENIGDMLIWRLISDLEFFEEYTAGMSEEEINDLLFGLIEGADVMQYYFILGTSADDYTIIYINNEILVLDGEFKSLEASPPIVSGDKLTISFNLPSSKENLTEIFVFTNEGGIIPDLGEINYYDEIPITECNDEAPVGGDDNNGDENKDDAESGLTVFIALIVIIAIAGIAVVVYLIRR